MYPLYLLELTGIQCVSNYLMRHCLILQIIVAFLGGFMIELDNSYYVKEVLLPITLGLLVGTYLNCQVNFLFLPNILLQQTKFFLLPSAGVLQLIPGCSHIPFVQK